MKTARDIKSGNQNWLIAGMAIFACYLLPTCSVSAQVTKPTILLQPQRRTMVSAGCVNGKYHTIATYGFHRFSADWNGTKAREITIAAHAIN